MATKSTKTTSKTTTRSAKRPTSVAARAPRVVEATIPDSYAPIGMWGYFAYELLFMIPVIGWICCIIFAITANNHNLRNFARSQFCWLIIYVIIFCILAGVGALRMIFESFGAI